MKLREGKCAKCQKTFKLRVRYFISGVLVKNHSEARKWDCELRFKCPGCGNVCEFVLNVLDTKAMGLLSRITRVKKLIPDFMDKSIRQFVKND